MSTLNPTAAQAREQARQTDGRFGEQHKTDPGQLDLGHPHTFPTQLDHQGTTYRRTKHHHPDHEPHTMAIRVNHPIDDATMNHIAQLVGYGYATHIRGDNLGTPQRVDPQTFTIEADTTTTRRSDLNQALNDFEECLPDLLTEGSPIRRTDRAGAGTRGTRLVEGVGNYQIAVYWNDPEQDTNETPTPTQPPAMTAAAEAATHVWTKVQELSAAADLVRTKTQELADAQTTFDQARTELAEAKARLAAARASEADEVRRIEQSDLLSGDTR